MNTHINKPTRKYIFLLHLTSWLVYIALECSPFIGTPFKFIAFYVLIPFIVYISLFYFCAEYFFPIFYDKKKIFRFILLNLLLIVFHDWMITIILKYFSKPFGIPMVAHKFTSYSYKGIVFMAFAAAYWIAKRLIAIEKRNKTLIENHYVQELREEDLKQAIATAELAYIRAQINPHFLFNTLNFLYSSIYPLSGDIAKSVLTLSDIMRFVIENNEGGTTDLVLEIKHIENYIKLSRLQSEQTLYVDFEHTGISGDKKIIPFILMTLVENAFKHGDLTDVRNPLKIQLDMRSEDIRFYINNKISPVKLYERHGIGMDNLKKCLELFYGNRFKLSIQNDGQQYSCILNIEVVGIVANTFQLD
jgi:two-component system LytT family sensor kinase